MKLYRAISLNELADFQNNKFQCTERTLTVKQFFKSRKAVEDFISKSVMRDYDPPYTHILEIEIDEDMLKKQWYDEQILDTHRAINIYEDFLPSFNKCFKFMDNYGI
jgi:hypothetical protein